jgi:hypothetical protein
VHPDSLNPAFQVNPDPIRIEGFDDDQKLEKKNVAEIFLYLVLIKNCNLLMSKLKKPSAFKRENPPLQKMRFINLFLCLWVIFALLDPDPDCESGFGYGSRDPSNPDPDPLHW